MLLLPDHCPTQCRSRSWLRQGVSLPCEEASGQRHRSLSYLERRQFGSAMKRHHAAPRFHPADWSQSECCVAVRCELEREELPFLFSVVDRTRTTAAKD